MMLRLLCYRVYPNWVLQDSYKQVAEKYDYIKNVNNIRKSKLYSSCYCSAYFLNDENRKQQDKTVYSLYKIGYKPFHTNTAYISQLRTTALDFNKASDVFFKIRMEELKSVPSPAFWVGMCGLVPFWFPVFSSFIIGYSHFFASAQYIYAAVLLSCMGGIKWGSIIHSKESWNWENFVLSVVPSVFAITALSVPKFIGYVILITGFLSAFLIDLTTSNYPKWFIALRGVLTNISVFFLIIAMIKSLFH